MSIGGLLIGKAWDLSVDRMLDDVIGLAIAKASKHRSRRFIEALIEAVRLEVDHDVSEDELNELLAKLANKTNSEAVFDACSRACLSRSKDIGPRIIAFLTAVLPGEERGPTDEEEMILDVAERLNDDELSSLVDIIRLWEKELVSGLSKMVRAAVAGYALAYELLHQVTFTYWVLIAGFRLAALIYVPRRYWVALAVGELIPQIYLAITCEPQYGWLWSVVVMTFIPIVLAMPAVYCCQQTLRMTPTRGGVRMDVLLFCILLTTFRQYR
ncbi:hypothetical protein [Dyella sp.]|uniref:hypothetical protein n=1 Tax=Dyella sp. TaxID=1869338 RepID=UPI002ED15080